MTRVERTVAEDVPGPPDEVRGFYVDLDNIKLVIRWWCPCGPSTAAKRRMVMCRPTG